MATTTTAPDLAATTRIQNSFAARDKIAESIRQVEEKRLKAADDYLSGLIGGNFDGAQVLAALNAWKTQDADLASQLAALAETDKMIEALHTKLAADDSPIFKQVLESEITRLAGLIAKGAEEGNRLGGRKRHYERLLESLNPAPSAPSPTTLAGKKS